MKSSVKDPSYQIETEEYDYWDLVGVGPRGSWD